MLVDPVGHVRDCLAACRWQLDQAGIAPEAVAAQRVTIVADADPLPDACWLHVFSAVRTVIAESGALDLEALPAAHARALRTHAMSEFYLAQCSAHPDVATAAFDQLDHWLRTRPELHAEGARKDRSARATDAAGHAGEAHRANAKPVADAIEKHWLDLAKRGVGERSRASIIAPKVNRTPKAVRTVLRDRGLMKK